VINLQWKHEAAGGSVANLESRFGNIAKNAFIGAELLSECGPRTRTQHHEIERAAAEADETHAVVYSTWPQPSLSNFKAPAFSQQNVVQGHAHVVESALGYNPTSCAMRRAAIANLISAWPPWLSSARSMACT
jgi:hypothetical protein